MFHIVADRVPIRLPPYTRSLLSPMNRGTLLFDLWHETLGQPVTTGHLD
ncbi:MAG: hypothetical protein ACO4AI_14510 [Prochlorothrix sp.]